MIRFIVSLALAFLTCSAMAQNIKVVYHVNTGVDTVNATLNNIRNHLDDDPNVHIVVVSHGPGIDFMVSDARDSKGREFSGPVGELANRGVEFRVCQNTLRTRGMDATSLLLEARIVSSGVAEIARLQAREGYAYLKP